MRSSTRGILIVIISLGGTAPATAEAGWLDSIRSFFTEPANSGEDVSEPIAAAPESDESGWLGKFKAFFAKPATSYDDADSADANTSEPTRATPAPVRQAGDPAEFLLSGNWSLSGMESREIVGSLKANGAYFRLALQEPSLDLRSIYQQGPDGGFRATTLDKQVIVVEGNFENKDHISLRGDIKEIGKPAVKS